MTFFVYEDWTLEEIPRCFYVGKGSLARVEGLQRNCVHKRIAMKHGIRRVIVLETSTEKLALEHEIELIAKYRTYINGGDDWWGANLTRGGEGVSGLKHTLESRQKMSLAKKGKPSTFTGNKHSEETKRVMSQKALGRRLSQSARLKVSLATTGEKNPRSKLSNEFRNKVVDMHLSGLQNKLIAQQLNIVIHSVNNILVRWRKRGNKKW